MKKLTHFSLIAAAAISLASMASCGSADPEKALADFLAADHTGEIKVEELGDTAIRLERVYTDDMTKELLLLGADPAENEAMRQNLLKEITDGAGAAVLQGMADKGLALEIVLKDNQVSFSDYITNEQLKEALEK